VKKSYEEPAMRKRYIRWPLATDEKAKVRVRELRIKGGLSGYVGMLVLDDWEQSRGREPM
jgi:hypothetical protein